MKNILSSLNSVDAKICNSVLNKYFQKAKKNIDSMNDLLSVGYVAILEFRKKNDCVNVDDFVSKAYSVVRQAMSNFTHKNFLETGEHICSLDKKIKDDNNSHTIGDLFGSFDKLDLDTFYIKDKFKNVWCSFSKRDRAIIKYFYKNVENKKDFVKLYKTFGVKRKYAITVIRSFRNKLADSLVDCGIITKNFLKGLKDPDEFTQNYVLTLKYYRLKKYSKNRELYFYQDMFICKLIRDNNLILECAKLLDLSTGEIKKRVYHQVGSKKFYLYQIQKIRKAFFSNYTLEDLCKYVSNS